jgi:HEPN domain-containing protein
MKPLTRAWVKRAEAEYHVAVLAAGADPAPHDHVCFYSRAVAGTYLNALLQELGRPVPRTSDPGRLASMVLPYHPELRTIRRGLCMLSQFDITILYPGRRATKRQATSAVRWSTRVRATCRAILGLREPRRRKSP